MKYLLIIVALNLACGINAQDVLGQWVTYDDNTNDKKAIIEIYEQGGFFFAKIVKSFVSEANALCETCKGENYRKPITGLVIIENLREDGDEYNEGTILDPENGETYSCYLKLVGKDRLKVRGYLGFSLLGRTQYWERRK